ncbi:MAG: hypothetical protein HY744_23375 [Deltaproteobacteria bacterium]|nr:hypothetical protein [Deltaproteobacteria bacterium]
MRATMWAALAGLVGGVVLAGACDVEDVGSGGGTGGATTTGTGGSGTGGAGGVGAGAAGSGGSASSGGSGGEPLGGGGAGAAGGEGGASCLATCTEALCAGVPDPDVCPGVAKKQYDAVVQCACTNCLDECSGGAACKDPSNWFVDASACCGDKGCTFGAEPCTDCMGRSTQDGGCWELISDPSCNNP